jgi:hypothetical protein
MEARREDSGAFVPCASPRAMRLAARRRKRCKRLLAAHCFRDGPAEPRTRPCPITRRWCGIGPRAVSTSCSGLSETSVTLASRTSTNAVGKQRFKNLVRLPGPSPAPTQGQKRPTRNGSSHRGVFTPPSRVPCGCPNPRRYGRIQRTDHVVLRHLLRLEPRSEWAAQLVGRTGMERPGITLRREPGSPASSR